jgi:hypothetical protein
MEFAASLISMENIAIAMQIMSAQNQQKLQM